MTYRSPNDLPETDRLTIAGALNGVLADAIDLRAQVKVAHWNVRGPLFVPFHTLFDEIAGTLDAPIDDVAERVATLGGRAEGTARDAARASRLPELPAGASRDRELGRLVAERLELFLGSVREARRVADGRGDVDTSDLLTGLVRAVEKQGWMLRASLAE